MASNRRIGLYFGTFNPIHIGHLVIANHMVEYSELDEGYLSEENQGATFVRGKSTQYEYEVPEGAYFVM